MRCVSQPIEHNMRGLKLRMVDGVLHFQDPGYVKRLSTATLRGLAGHALCEHAPEMIDRWFKPVEHAEKPPAYLFEPLHAGGGVASGFPFRLVAWDPPGEFIPAVQRALAAVAGTRGFGAGNTAVLGVEWGTVCELCYEGIHEVTARVTLDFVTPLQLKYGALWLNERTLTVGHLVRAMINRLNRLSRWYGNGEQLDPQPFMEQVALMREIRRDLKFVRQQRWSSTGKKKIYLDGLTGQLTVANPSSAMVSLFAVAQILHIGRHSVEGCGQLVLK